MNEELVRKIASEIANQTIIQNWYIYALLLCVGFLGSYFGSYIKGYAAEKSRNKAIKSDLEEIKLRISETTRVTEEIKNEIEHDVWRKKSIESMKRQKLEEYFNLIFAGRESLHDQMISAFFHKEETYDRHALNKADILQKLYFPELDEAHQAFRGTVGAYKTWISNGQKMIVLQMEKGAIKPSPPPEHMDLQSDVLELINNATHLLVEAGKEYAESLNA